MVHVTRVVAFLIYQFFELALPQNKKKGQNCGNNHTQFGHHYHKIRDKSEIVVNIMSNQAKITTK